MDPLSAAASIVALLQLTGSVIKYLHGVKNASDDIKCLTLELCTMKGLLSTLEDTLDAVDPMLLNLLDGPDGVFKQLRSTLEQLLSKTGSAPSNNLGKLLRFPFKKGDIDNSLSSVERQKGVLSLILQGNHLELAHQIKGDLADVGNGVKQLQSASKDARNREIVRWLSAPDPSINHTAACIEHSPSTGDWFITSEAFRSWWSSPNEYLWVYGMPGCGKSVLASTIIEHIMVLCEKDSIRRNILYFYFDFRQDIKQTRDGFLRSMLVQLSCTFTVFPEELEKLYLQHESKKQQPTISSFIETFISLLKRSKPSYLVIDALDECSMRGSQERQGMLNLIRRLKTDGFEHLNLMILSRKEQDIENGLINVFTNNVHIQNKTVDADIRVHVRRLLADDARLNKKSPAVKAEIEKRLVFGAGGMFRWVSCQVDALRRCRRASSIREALDNLPETLDETYDRILLSIPHEDRKDALAALHFLAFSACPVSVADVAEAVIVDHHSCSFDPEDRLPDPFDIVDVLSTLVICSSTQIAMGTERAGHDRYPGAERATEIRLAHYSVQEYLLSDRIRKGKASAFHISVYEAHKSVAEMCLIYLLQFDRPDSISRSMILDTPLALYAAQYWFQHARIAFENPDHKRDSESNLTRLCVDLLSPEKSSSFINWLTLCDPCDRKRIDFGRTLENMAEPLHYACYAGLLEVVRILRDNGADVNSRAPGDKWVIRTPLKGAIQGSSEGVVGFLLASNVDINAVNDWGCTALHQAALQGNESIVKLLIEHGANTKARTGPTMPYSKVEMPTEDPLKTIGSLIGNFTGLTKREETAAAITHHLLRKQMHLESAHFTIDPITRWPRYGHCSVLRVLLYGGDKAELKFATGWTPLHEAAWIGHVGVVRLLRGIDVECKTRYGWTAILLAAWNGHKDVVRELVQSGATIDTRNVYGWTALHAASKRGHEDVVRFLLDNGADIEAETSYGWTALFGALGDEYDNTLALLLERGADPNAHNSFGGTALHRAARAGRRRSVELLLQAGADPSIKSAYGTTAIEETTFQGNETVVRLLSSSSEQPLDKADAREP